MLFLKIKKHYINVFLNKKNNQYSATKQTVMEYEVVRNLDEKASMVLPNMHVK
jgi:hypothetical protein